MTPYEAYRNRKTNIKQMRVFGCLAYSKVVGPHVKKLDGPSKKTIHFGMEPGTKGYCLYEPINRNGIVLREVVFDKKSS